MISKSLRRQKLLLLFLLTMSFSFFSQAQTATVFDRQTGEVLELASFKSETGALATTNVAGQTDLSAFRGAKTIEVRMLGYETAIFSYRELRSKSFNIRLKQAELEFDALVVSATRWGQSSRNIASKVSLIKPAEVALLNPQTAADLLGGSGEVFIQKSQQGGGSPMIRGFATNRLLYAVDGVRMNTAIFRAGNLQNVISLDPFAIESTEVLFGPGSVSYGSDAIGGVMNFTTLNPQFSYSKKPLISANAVSRYSSANDEKTFHFDAKIGWKKWASVTSITHSDYGDLMMGSKGPEEYLKPFYVIRQNGVDQVIENPNPKVQLPTGYKQLNLMQKVRYRPAQHWDLQYGFHFSETSDYPRYDRLMATGSDGSPSSAVWNYGPQIWRMHNFSVTHSESNALYDLATLRLAKQYFQESRIDRKFNHHRLRTQLEEVDAYSVNLDFSKKVKSHSFNYGAEYVLNQVSSNASAIDLRNDKEMSVEDRYPASTWNSLGIFLNYLYSINSKLDLQAGARYNAFGLESDFNKHTYEYKDVKLNNQAVTGNLGLVFRPDNSWKISAVISTGFRAPNVDDIGKLFDFSAGNVVIPNPSLSAEHAYNGELSIMRNFSDRVKVDVSGFYTYLDRAMVRRAYQVNGQDSIMYNGTMSKVFAIQNAAYATVYGFNVGIDIRLGGGFSLNSRYNYQIGKEELEGGSMEAGQMSRSRHAAPPFGVSRLTYKNEKLQMQLYSVYSAGVSYENLNEEERQKPVLYAIDTDGNPYSPSWYTLNLKAIYQFMPNLSLSAGIENITDQRYRPYSSGLTAPGRNFVASLRLSM